MTDLTDVAQMLGRVEGKVDGIIASIAKIETWQTEHEAKDSERITALHQRIDGMNRYAASIAIVASAIGAGASWLWNKVMG